MCILIPFAVIQVFHQFGGRIANYKRNRFRNHIQGIHPGCIVSYFHSIGFWRQRHIHHSLRQMHRTLRHTDKMTGLIRRHRNFQRPGIRHAHVFAGKPCHPAGHIQRVLSCFQHPGQPVHRCIRVRIAHALMQRRYQIIMFFPVFIVKQRFFGNTLLQYFFGHNDRVVLQVPVQHYHFQSGQGRACIPVGKIGNKT